MEGHALRMMLSKGINKAYTKILAGIIICIVSTLLISSTILYINFESIAKKQLYTSDLNSLMQTSHEVSIMTETAKSLTTQILIDPSFTKLLYTTDPDITEVTAALRNLGFYRLSLPFISSIYIYNGKNKELFISAESKQTGRQSVAELDDKGIIEIIHTFDRYRPYTPIPRSYKIGIASPIEVSTYTYLGYDMLLDRLENAVIVNFDVSWINQHVDQANNNSIGETFIINSDGILYANKGTTPMLTDMRNEAYIQNIMNNPDSPGFFEQDIEGNKSLVTYTSADELGWRYVRITPLDQIALPIRKMRSTTVLISVGILLLGLFISVFMSRKLYSPLSNALHRMKALEHERRNHLQIVKHELLRNVILGREAYSSRLLQEKLQAVGSKIDVNQKFQLILFKIDHYKEFLERFGDDSKLIKYAIMNICNEIALQAYTVEALDMHEDQVLLILSYSDISEEQIVLGGMLKQMQTAIKHHLRLSVSLIISPIEEAVDRLGLLFKQISEAAEHRIFLGEGCIIYSEEIMGLRSKVYDFPLHKEKQLSESIMVGKADDAKRIFAEIIQETAEYPITAAQLAISHLTMTVSRVLNTINRNNALVIESELDTTLLALHQVQRIEDLNQRFYDLFDEITRKLEEKKSSKHEELVRRINELIDHEYSNFNLGLNSIADLLDMSPVYISRLYKQLTMKAITDVISEVRMSKAKQMLLHTEMSISDIAEKTGFTNSSYFYRMFKKTNGVTPNDYRRISHEDRDAK
jgi:two-component system response regulator YesN